MRAHDTYAPSALQRIAACPGCLKAAAGLPEVESPAGESGTRIHDLVASYLSRRAGDGDAAAGLKAIPDDVAAVSGGMEDMAGDMAGDDVLTAAACAVYAGQAARGCGCTGALIEAQVDAGGLTRGYVDLALEAPGKVVVIDWKTGRGEVPEAQSNLQGMAYALGAALQCGRDVAEVHFFQPRAARPLSVAVFGDMGALYETIAGVMDAAEAEDAPLHDGAHCRYCRAYQWGVCPLLAGRAAAVREQAAKAGSAAPEDPEELRKLWENLQHCATAFEALKRAVSAHIAESPAGTWNGFRRKTLGGGWEVTDMAAVADAVSGLLDADRVLGCCSLSLEKLKREYGKMGKATGHYPTAAQAADAMMGKIAQWLKPKAARVTVVPPGTEEGK